MFDPTKFSDESVNQFKTEGWEDNRFRLPIPGTRCTGTIQSLENDREWDGADGKKYMGMKVTLGSTNPAGITADQYLNSMPRPWGNKVSSLEDLIQVSGLDFEQNMSNRDIATLLQQIWTEQIPVGFSITWEGWCRSLFEITLMTSTNTDTVEEAEEIATKKQKKEANKAATLKAGDFKNGNGSYETPTTCDKTGQEVRARLKIKEILVADDVDDQLGG